MLLFYVKTLFLYSTVGLGVFGAIKFYLIVRILESHWFVWVSQSNHIPMNIDDDDAKPWFHLQVRSYVIEHASIGVCVYNIKIVFVSVECFLQR